MKIYSVRAVDQFGRLFGYDWIDPLSDSTIRLVSTEWVLSEVFLLATHEVLRAMGEAANAEWWCEVRDFAGWSAAHEGPCGFVNHQCIECGKLDIGVVNG